MADSSIGLRLIIGYKLAKIPVVLVLAIWLTLAGHAALRAAHRLAFDLAESGPIGSHVAAWIQAHISGRVIVRAALVAWFDLVTTAVEVVLLWRGKAWGEWLVAGGLAALIVPEALFFEHRPSALRLLVLILNALVAAYLVSRQLTRARARARASRI